MKYFNITKRCQFYLVIEECNNLENLSDSFITDEKMSSEGRGHSHGKYYLTEKIRGVLAQWAEMIQPDSLSTRVMPQDVRSLVFECSLHILERYAPEGYTVGSDRIYHKARCREHKQQQRETEELRVQTKREAEMNAPYERPDFLAERDKSHFTRGINDAIRTKYNVNSKLNQSDGPKAASYAHRLLNWNEVRRAIKTFLPSKQYRQDIVWAKYLWDNPEKLYHY